MRSGSWRLGFTLAALYMCFAPCVQPANHDSLGMRQARWRCWWSQAFAVPWYQAGVQCHRCVGLPAAAALHAAPGLSQIVRVPLQFEAGLSDRQIGILASASKQPSIWAGASATAPASDVQQMHLWALSPREITQLEPSYGKMVPPATPYGKTVPPCLPVSTIHLESQGVPFCHRRVLAE